MLARLCEDYGIPETCSTDGASNYTSARTERFMKDYGIRHRISSVAFAHSNCRAELAVKSMKRMIRENLTTTVGLDTIKFSRALLQYRNTKDRDTGVSPAQSLMGRELRDFIPRSKDQLMAPVWHELAGQREAALAIRGSKLKERLTAHTKELIPLAVGDTCVIQNQSGNFPKRWDKTGTIVAQEDFDQYRVRLDGSRRITLRNRKFLRKVTSFRDSYSPSTPTYPDSVQPHDRPILSQNTNQPGPTQLSPPPIPVSDIPVTSEQIEDIPDEDSAGVATPDQGVVVDTPHAVSETEVRSRELRRLAGHNNPGRKENWEAQSRLRPRR